MDKRKFLTLLGIESHSLWLYRLSYPGSSSAPTFKTNWIFALLVNKAIPVTDGGGP
jgi:hypothetical protein